jgi:uncharacterized protein (TIGR03790 family)
VYETQIERPVGQWLGSHSAQDRILYIVLVKGVPLRIAAAPSGAVTSIDSELPLLYRRLTGANIPSTGRIKNPYFAGEAPLSATGPFTHQHNDIYLVARLDGFTVADVKGLIDRGITPAMVGVIVLDEASPIGKPAGIKEGNAWLAKAATVVGGMAGWKDRVVHNTDLKMVTGQSNVIGYYSWGSNDAGALINGGLPRLGFVPGAIGGTYASAGARTFQAPPADWVPWGKEFAGSSQALIGQTIHQGVTGVVGYVADPYLSAAIRPDILFPAYLSGFNLIEAFYAALPVLGWQTVVVGDPLSAPFRQQPLTAQAIDPGIDSVTEQPTFLTAHRIEVMANGGVKKPAARLAIRAEVRLLKKDVPAAREALEQATAIDEGYANGHLLLAGMYDAAHDWNAAIGRYRRVLVKVPNHVVALNNLAFALAEHNHEPGEALPYAERAFTLSKGAPPIADTLGWIHHLLGHDEEAERLLLSVTKGPGANAGMHVHLAIVLAARGKTQEAARELEAASRLDKSIEARDDVKQLRDRLKITPPNKH